MGSRKKKDRKFYIRLVSTLHQEDNLERDSAMIEKIIGALGFATLAKPPEMHGRGGYSVYVDCPKAQRLDVLEALALYGFRGVI